MGITKISMTLLLLVIIATSFSNYNVLASEIKPMGRISDMCKNTCSATYGDGKCADDCRKAGFSSEKCLTSSLFGNKCCCNK
ncbi:defensin-like protein 43 [Capsella rubella]|uniref:defensin-like protein 43 n=1 Tax=Capsella rubella TaxID=81985 RepID=UPI000CD4CD3C|nr:defensin-like protein 43 [Capsella rubella]